MFKTKSGKTFDPRSAKEIAAGGEGKIYESVANKKEVIKIYHTPRPNSFKDHLAILAKLPNEFIKPREVYFDGKDNVAGFDMLYVNFNDYWLFNSLFNKGFCNSNSIDKSFKIKVLSELKNSLTELHKQGIVVGDLNQYNLFVSKKGEILFVDVDSYATKANSHSGVLLDDIRDWTTNKIDPQTDSFSFDVLAFWVTTFCHPFKWVVSGNTETIEQRVKSSKSFLSKITGMKYPALYEPPVGVALTQFDEVFKGRRYMVDFGSAPPAVNVVVKQQVTSTALSIRLLHENVVSVNSCDNFISFRVGANWLLLDCSIAKVTRETSSLKCDELYPSESKPAHRIGNVLFSHDGKPKEFDEPEFYYADSSLSVVDYAKDLMWNFNLNNQLSGIDNTSIPVFAKSILFRDSPIQNFGLSKFLNVPIRNSYSLIKVPQGTKNAYYKKGYTACEYKNKNTVAYSILHHSLVGSLELDYLPFFAVKGDLIFIPENGKIEVYKNHQLVATLDVSICTRDSKLYSTTAGIILFENKSIFLLNTK